ncbi:hypothetical protein NLX83_30540 [Allokutzneria sp. A3M-2-11 16]|uniref:hypothetical protein n=1 Tax=Allokutzneria sp. A3M-2-11 16 TaxID=2962043 RepID=UPI0020B8425D|nr:hypothetical protein [Allokutzneria sp. A3M-2-11 16]MCP3803619.1 hypothetical protein [Allokutzneria sp. A3M-2-11 16]
MGAAVAGLLAGTPLSAFAGPTNEWFKTKSACEKRAAEIRDTANGAWCEYKKGKPRPWRLYISGS